MKEKTVYSILLIDKNSQKVVGYNGILHEELEYEEFEFLNRMNSTYHTILKIHDEKKYGVCNIAYATFRNSRKESISTLFFYRTLPLKNNNTIKAVVTRINNSLSLDDFRVTSLYNDLISGKEVDKLQDFYNRLDDELSRHYTLEEVKDILSFD